MSASIVFELAIIRNLRSSVSFLLAIIKEILRIHLNELMLSKISSMKNFIIVLSLLITQVLFAQSDSASSPAIAPIKSFWKQIDKLKATNPELASFKSGIQLAENYHKSVKKQDPSFNTVHMDKALEQQRARLPKAAAPVVREGAPATPPREGPREGNREGGAGGGGSTADRRERQATVEAMFDSLFIGYPYQGPSGNPGDEARNAALLERYKQNTVFYVAKNIPPDDRTMYEMTRKHGLDTAGVTKDLKQNGLVLRTSSETGAIGGYDLTLAMEAFWSAAATIFHNKPEYAAAHKQVKDTLAYYGSRDQVNARLAKNLENRGSNVFMPVAARQDAALEQEFRSAFAKEGWNETVLKVNILTTEWSILRNNVTGAIIGRTQTAAIAAKNAKGECILYNYTIIQEYDGSKYLSAKRRSHGAQYIACKNVK